MLDLTATHGATGTTIDAEPDAALLALPGLLARAGSGIAFIYEALELVAERYDLRDALLVVGSAEVTRQAFRLGRRVTPPAAGSPLPSVLDAGPGLHADPDVVDPATAAFVTDLAEIALRLDVARHDASRDSLTGLLNRRSYEDALAQAAARSRRYGWPFALVLLDLDQFKAINDQWGHHGGDDALRTFGADLRSCLRSGDVAARVGGDEFALLVLAASGQPAVESLVERLRQTTERTAGRVGLRFSAGVAYFPDDASDVASLVRVADERLYADKAAVRP